MKKSILLEITVDTHLTDAEAAEQLVSEMVAMKDSTAPDEGVDWIVNIKLYGDGEVVTITDEAEQEKMMMGSASPSS